VRQVIGEAVEADRRDCMGGRKGRESFPTFPFPRQLMGVPTVARGRVLMSLNGSFASRQGGYPALL
jgi:hypothetical protein